MKFQLGDKVVLRHTGTEGVVTRLELDGMYLVRVGEVEIPVFKEDLDHPYFDWFTKEKDRKKKLKQVQVDQMPVETERKASLPSGVYLAFFPVYDSQDADLIEKFRIYLVNQQKENVYFSYKAKLQQQKLFDIKAQAYTYTNFYIHDISMENMHAVPGFQVQFLNARMQAISDTTEIKIRAKKLFEYINELHHGNVAFFHVPIEVKKHQEEWGSREISLKPGGASQVLKQNRVHPVIDLHIEQLTDHWQSLSPAEMLEIQLNACEQALSEAIAAGATTLTIIHGVGKGVLKAEIHKMLKAEPMVSYFISDWMPKYGHGATQVFF